MKEDLIVWSPMYSTGIKILDDQHKGLCNIINELFNHSTGDEVEERNYFKEVIQEMVQYIKEHFATEEKIMLATKYPGYAEQKKSHDEFTLKVINSVRDFEAGKRLVLVKLANFLKEWLLSHIAIMDIQYADYFKGIATRKADGKLSITMNDVHMEITPKS